MSDSTVRQYEKSKDISKLPPIRQLYNTLHKLKEPDSEDTSRLADFIIALSRAIRMRGQVDPVFVKDRTELAEILSGIVSPVLIICLPSLAKYIVLHLGRDGNQAALNGIGGYCKIKVITVV